MSRREEGPALGEALERSSRSIMILYLWGIMVLLLVSLIALAMLVLHRDRDALARCMQKPTPSIGEHLGKGTGVCIAPCE